MEHKVKRIIFIKLSLEVLNYFSEQLCDAAKKMGLDTYVIDLADPQTYGEALDRIAAEEGNMVYAFNQVGSLLEVNGKNYWKEHHIPFFSHMVDHPYNYEDALMRKDTDLHYLVIDRNHEKFIRKYFPWNQRILFLPNGGNTTVTGELLEYHKRPIDILYVGNCNPNPTVFPPLPEFSDQGQEYYQVVCNLLLEHPFLTVEEAIECYLDNCGTTFSLEQKRKIITSTAIFLSEKIRRHFKLKIMHQLEQLGVDIEIYGDNWEDEEREWGKNIHIHSRVSSEECNRLMGMAKIGLNFMPWYKEGCSERVFNIMLNGAVCVTDISEYLFEQFTQGQELVFYELDHIQDLVENIRWLLSNPDQAAKIAQNGYQTAKEKHSWECRLKEVLLAAEAFYQENEETE